MRGMPCINTFCTQKSANSFVQTLSVYTRETNGRQCSAMAEEQCILGSSLCSRLLRMSS